MFPDDNTIKLYTSHKKIKAKSTHLKTKHISKKSIGKKCQGKKYIKLMKRKT